MEKQRETRERNKKKGDAWMENKKMEKKMKLKFEIKIYDR